MARQNPNKSGSRFNALMVDDNSAGIEREIIGGDISNDAINGVTNEEIMRSRRGKSVAGTKKKNMVNMTGGTKSDFAKSCWQE